MNILSLDLVKQYLKIDVDEEDDLLKLLIRYADAVILEKTGVVVDSSNVIVQIALLKIIEFNYKHRDSVIDKKSFIIPRYIDMDLFLIKYGDSNGTE